ncbi:uncharacterized protein LOC144158156 isoform X3 [Haemaphysalis longicornis]
MSTDEACSQHIQATIITTATGTQCCLTLLTDAGSQTEEEFPGTNDAQAGPWEKCPALRYGSDTALEKGPYSCTCGPHSHNIGDSKEIQCAGKHFSCLCDQQHQQPSANGKTCLTEMPYICTVCKKVFNAKCNLDIHMRVHTECATMERVGMPQAMSSMPEGVCGMAMSTDVVHSRNVSDLSQDTQTAITSSAIGTQCSLMLFINASSQTEEELSVQDGHNTQDGASEKFPASGGGAIVAAEVGPDTFSCHPCSGNTGSFSTESKKIQLGGKLHSSLSEKQRDHHISHGEVCPMKTTSICTFGPNLLHKKCSLDIHMELYTGKNPLVCSTCNKSFNCRPALLRHEVWHSGEKPYMCNICSKSFTYRADLVNHERVHSGEKPYACSICGKCFTTISQLARHKRLHSSEKPYVCTICQKGFKEKCLLSNHLKLHSGERPYVCSVCQQSFTQRGHLVTHERLHSGERPYVCSICQKSFTQSGHLVAHERLHSGKKPYVCSICQKSFTQRGQLAVHERLHSGERPYVCSICQKSFREKRNLVAHETLHSGKKPYVCSVCQKSFTVRSSLVCHERSHSAEKPYVCSICQKTFTQKGNLVAHERLHTGEKPYVCGICQKSFSEKRRLVAHERVHSGE